MPATPSCSWTSKIVDRREADKRNPAAVVRTRGLPPAGYSASGGKRLDLLGPGSGADAPALIEQLEADANYCWLPTDRELEDLGPALLKSRPDLPMSAEKP
jgi:hypothetical protein